MQAISTNARLCDNYPNNTLIYSGSLDSLPMILPQHSPFETGLLLKLGPVIFSLIILMLASIKDTLQDRLGCRCSNDDFVVAAIMIVLGFFATLASFLYISIGEDNLASNPGILAWGQYNGETWYAVDPRENCRIGYYNGTLTLPQRYISNQNTSPYLDLMLPVFGSIILPVLMYAFTKAIRALLKTHYDYVARVDANHTDEEQPFVNNMVQP